MAGCKHGRGVTRPGTRQGAVNAFVLVSLTTFMAAFAIAISSTRTWTVRANLQAAADAAALAGTQTLADEDFLRGDPNLLPPLLALAGSQASVYADSNFPEPNQSLLQANPTNDTNGDIVFGTLDNPRASNFVPAQNISSAGNSSLFSVNAVRIRALLSSQRGNAVGAFFGPLMAITSFDVQAAATAMMDRDVIGLRPFGAHPLLLAPLAFFSDPQATNTLSWQWQVGSKMGTDQFRFDRSTNQLVIDQNGDGIHEFHAFLTEGTQAPSPNVQVLLMGVNDPAGIARQMNQGILASDLQSFGGFLVLGNNNRVSVPIDTSGFNDPVQFLNQLHDELETLRQSAAVRIWPLYCDLNAASGTANVCGFVAARVARVGPVLGIGTLRFALQATVLATDTAVTDFTRRGVGGIDIVNPYICKVRLVE